MIGHTSSGGRNFVATRAVSDDQSGRGGPWRAVGGAGRREGREAGEGPFKTID